jgi:IMP dehydrogenase
MDINWVRETWETQMNDYIYTQTTYNDKLLNFSDILIEPIFSNVRSRKDVDVSTDFLGMHLSLPIVNSNMDTIASPALCRTLTEYGTIGTLHRFWSIEENVQAFKDSILHGKGPIVSIGLGDIELQRAKALYNAGAEIFMLDVAHSANVAVVEMYNLLCKTIPNNVKYIIGDFGVGKEISEFMMRVDRKPDAVKVGIGIGSQCITRLVTGVGNTAVSCLLDCAPVTEDYDIKLVLDGGVKEIGDITKALVAGADLIISGSMFAGTDEAAGINRDGFHKEYRGSASLESYEVQGKISTWRAPEGTSTLVSLKGPAINILNNISGGLRSSCSYVNAFNLKELKANAKFTFLK